MKYRPTMYMKNIYEVDFKKVYEKGYRVLFIDLDNTLVAHDEKLPDENVFQLIDNLKALGFKIVILSNNHKKRVETFADPLQLKYIYSARKPLTFKYKRLIAEQNYNKNEILCIGDQILTDVRGANKLGLGSMLVDPLKHKDIIFTKLNRIIEKFVYKKLARKGHLVKGQYYYD